MSNFFSLGHKLPGVLANPLFGDRKRFGLEIDHNDPCWQEWQETSLNFYSENQQKGIGEIVNRAGYQVMSWLDVSSLRILEIGPGNINHIHYWRATTESPSYVLADVDPKMGKLGQETLQQHGIISELVVTGRDSSCLPFEDDTFDLLVSFYSLEHIYPLEPYIEEFKRILKPGGRLIGAIPTEGGFGWGFGRFLTSRRWLKRNTGINPDKIICWEHPNFADSILNKLDCNFRRQRIDFWPLKLPSIDMNLIVKFLYENY